MAMALIGIAMMAGGVVGAGIQGGKAQATDSGIRKKIADTQLATSQIEEQFNKIMGDDDMLNDNMKDDINKAVARIETNHAELSTMRSDFNAQMKKLQLTGLIVISIMFFLLLFKWSGLENMLVNAIKSAIHKKKSKKAKKHAVTSGAVPPKPAVGRKVSQPTSKK